MSELAVTLLRLSYLLLLWIFILVAISVLRRDIYGTQITRHRGRGSRKGRLPAASDSRGTWNAAGAAPVGYAPGVGNAQADMQFSAPAAPASPRADMPGRVIVTSGSLRGTTLPLGDGPIIIGRSSAANLVLDDDYSSGRHAQLARQGGEWMLEDLGSTNGTFYNNERLHSPVPARVSGVIRIGQTTMELHR